MVMGLSERTAKEVLCCAAEAMPSLIINITESIKMKHQLEDQLQSQDQLPQIRAGASATIAEKPSLKMCKSAVVSSQIYAKVSFQ